MYTECLHYHALAAVLVFSIHYLIEIEEIFSIFTDEETGPERLSYLSQIYSVWNRISLAFF